ncbi:MAG: M6 family metalloprotease domain-containing protein [Bacteroidetes bacterium]|nr:M6 family metalloprotease domain-containing protein [Bacteroidota bacterium]MCL2303608.1 M6 family metalloprotease domain-containing protein [Lentimicrobiaceae bacterium]
MKKEKLLSFILLALFIFITPILYAVPATPHPVTLTQPNGDTLTVRIKGDERINWYESMDGYTLLFNQAGYLSYAQLDENGNLQPSDFIATNIDQRNFAIHSFLYKIDKNLFYSDIQKQLMLKIWEIEDEVAGMKNDKAVVGQYKTLCAFVQFPEKQMIKSMSEFEGLMNQLGYTGNGTGSVRDYFKESSYGQFDLIVTLCGIYTAPNSSVYYAGSTPGDGTYRARELARWCALQVAAEPDINFADYDSNNDGVVDGFHFIFAGIGQEAGGGAGTIWSHKWQFTPAVTKNGKSISVYSCSPELLSGTMITTIGVICHEMAHAFGAPDFYDTNYGTGGQYEGTGNWDLMAGGSWNGSPMGNRPPHPNMYTKVQFGWVTPMVLNAPLTVANMPNSAENPVAYRINTGNGSEHYLLENRQRIRFDTSVPGDGLLIYHVHNSVGTSCINCTHPQKMYPVCASSNVAIPVAGSSNYGNINSAGCPFPGTSGKTSFDGTSTPRMFHWTNTVINDKPITDITHSNRLISFNFMGGGAFVPVTDITGVPTSVTAGAPLALTSTVVPSSASNKTVVWSIKDAGNTGATLSGSTLNTTAPGAVVVAATIENGLAIGSPFVKDFTITVNKPNMAGTVTITGITAFGETLTANTTMLTSNPVIPNLGTLTYQWKRGATDIGFNNPTYALVAADIGSTITVTVTAGNCNGSITSNSTATITKATQEKPDAPTALTITQTSIVLHPISDCEYRMDGGAWQTSTAFSELTPNTTYYFEARKTETATHFASDPSSTAPFSTLPNPGYIIMATATGSGEITPEGEVVVLEGASQVFTMKAQLGWRILDVLVDDLSVIVYPGQVEYEYVFEDVHDNHAIHAIFEYLGIDDWMQNFAPLRIIPNPAYDFVELQITNYGLRISDIEFYNAFGQLVKIVPYLGEIKDDIITQRISISDLSQGIYLIKAGSRTAKLVVQ